MTVSNLKQAAALGAIVSVMAIPRIIEGGGDIISRMVMIFPAMTLVAGAATAWGKYAGMPGLFPARETQARGLRVALVAGLAMAPLLLAFDSDLQAAMAEALRSRPVPPGFNPMQAAMIKAWRARAVALAFPESVSGCLALALWSAGFETVFFRASTMAFLARVTRRQWIAVAGSVLIRGFVMLMMITLADVDFLLMVRLGGVMALSAVSCLLYARAGLPAAMLFAAILESRHLVRLFLERGW